MSIAQVSLNDTFDQWRQKTNLMINAVNTLGSAGTLLSVSSPASGDILVYDGTFFRNVAVSGDITIDSTGATTVVNSGTATSRGRNYFTGWMRGIY